MGETPLKPWLITEPDGTVLSAHCDCMAGLREACSHVGALLWYLEVNAQIKLRKTVTQEAAFWLIPGSVDNVNYAEIKEIEFTSADVKKRKLDCAISGSPVPVRGSLKLPDIPRPNREETTDMRRTLQETGTKTVILSVCSKYQKEYIPDVMKDGSLPKTLLSLKDEKYSGMDDAELDNACKELFQALSVTEDQARNAESLTREQRKCKEWYSLRAGRITASNMKAVCSGSVDSPSISTVNNICGKNKVFSNKAIQWGCDHEQTALNEYHNQMRTSHVNLTVNKCGLFISSCDPFIGASPDAVVSCDCCGEGVVEIKCPYCVRDQQLNEKSPDFLENGKLKKKHSYYYQVQTQLFVTEKDYCDFVVWTEKDMKIQRIEPETDFIKMIREKSVNYFLGVILPEVTASRISQRLSTETRKAQGTQKPGKVQKPSKVLMPVPVPSSSCSNTSSNNAQNDVSDLICLCQVVYNPNDETVIGCDNENCKSGCWFHLSCVSLKRIPKGKYYCPQCKIQMKKTGKR